MLVKLIKEDKLIYCENVLEFAIATFNKDFEYINLGEIGDKYLDYEIFMLKTNHEDIYIITEINEF